MDRGRQQNDLGRSAKEGESPVCEVGSGLVGIQSRAGHVEPRLKLGGPPSKAKYSSMTDSELVP